MSRLVDARVHCFLLLALSGCRPDPTGELSAEQMSAVVEREQPALQQCYQAGLAATPYEHDFQIQAVLRIRPDGSVADVKLDQGGIQGLGTCVKKSISAWRFPEAQVETRASLPLVFHPKVEQERSPELQLPPEMRALQGRNKGQR